jgi:hypothetical protein
MRQRLQPFQRERQMHAALVVGHRVNLVHDHGFNIAQNRPALLRREQDVERFRRRDQNVRRTLQHQPPVFCQRVAGAHRRADLRHQQPALACHLENVAQRHFQVFLNIIAQRL